MNNQNKRTNLDFNLKPLNEIIGKTIYYRKGRNYKFDKNGILVVEKVEVDEKKWGSVENHFRIQEAIDNLVTGPYSVMTLQHAAAKMKVGWTYEMLAEQLEKSKEHFKKIRELHDQGRALYELYEPPVGLDAFITKIERPIFQRMPENDNIKTFDYIKVLVNYTSNWDEDRIAYIKKNLKSINKMVVDYLKNNRQFQKYGIPIGTLYISKVLNRMDSTLEYVFEFKKELRDTE